MIAAMTRHFHSLRKLTRDHGWIHTLLGIVIHFFNSLRALFDSCVSLQNSYYSYSYYTYETTTTNKEEAENERMHLMTALELKQPGILFRGIILLAQGEVICNFITTKIHNAVMTISGLMTACDEHWPFCSFSDIITFILKICRRNRSFQ